jgi:hypothetical protein
MQVSFKGAYRRVVFAIVGWSEHNKFIAWIERTVSKGA